MQTNAHIHVNYIHLLNASRIGCHISDVCINHVFYADDLCLMAPCVIALQDLLTFGYRYSVLVNLNFSVTESFCVGFTPKHHKLSLPMDHCLFIFFFTRKILLENQQNSSHKKERYIHIYTDIKTYNKPTNNRLSLTIYIK